MTLMSNPMLDPVYRDYVNSSSTPAGQSQPVKTFGEKIGGLGMNKGGGTSAAPAVTPNQPQPTSGGLGGGKGGGAAVAPQLTERGTYFNESGVKMMPQVGPGGAKPIPYAAGSLQGAIGAQPQPPMAMFPQPQQAAQQPGFNVNTASAGALQGALGATQQAMQGPLNVGAYANPYTSAVIDRTQQDIERQRQMAMNTLGAQATAANAFGGSRQGVAEGVMAGEYGRISGDMAAQQRQANYSQALQAAMADRTSRLGAASQMGQLGQQAFQTGQTIQQQQQQAGLLQQGIQQALIDAAKGQYAGYTGAPQQALQAPLAALGVAPTPQATTNSMQPGLYNYLQLGASMVPGLAKAGIICWVAREVYGEDNPKWLQFREWVIGYSPDWFYKAYSKYGERVAKVVAKVPALKLAIRPFMDAKRKAIGYK